MKRSALLGFLALLTAPAAQAGFEVTSKPLTFDEAEKSCVAKGGRLASLTELREAVAMDEIEAEPGSEFWAKPDVMPQAGTLSMMMSGGLLGSRIHKDARGILTINPHGMPLAETLSPCASDQPCDQTQEQRFHSARKSFCVFDQREPASKLLKTELSFPGPGNLSYLPLDLAPKLGADREQGLQILIRHTGGGGVALQNLVAHKVSFAIAGMPAVMSEAVRGGDVVAIAAVNDAPSFVLMVRSDLKNKVRRIADLKGRTIGVNTSSLTSKTTSQQLAELLLKSDGVEPNQVRIVPAGQSWEEQSSILESGGADAIMGDEPFATRLLTEKKVFFLANLADPQASRRIPGGRFLHAALVTRKDVIAKAPELIDKTVAMLKTTLNWMKTHSAEDVADKLGVTEGAARKALVQTLRKYPDLYTGDGKFSKKQLKETEDFFKAAFRGDAAAEQFKLDTIIDDRWVGRKE